mgnify:CR=1 FL=1
MLINKKTKVYISISKFPGNTGALLHNTGYKIHNLNSIYIPFMCSSSEQLKKILQINKFSGISVSMPFKSTVIKYLNKTDKASKKVKAVNTILRRGKFLSGFNTDYFALKTVIKNRKLNIKTATILGNGSTSRTSYEVLKELNIKKIYLCSRKNRKFKLLKLRKFDKILNWKIRHKIRSDLLINCTPLGMISKNILPIKLRRMKQFKYIIDFPINPKTKLSKISNKLKIIYIGGLEISLYQGLKQFNIYTGKKINFNKMKKILNYRFNV